MYKDFFLKHKKAICIIVAAALLVLTPAGYDVIRKSELRDSIKTELLEESLYTPRTYQTYMDALDHARDVSSDFFADEELIEEATTQLQSCFDSLRLKPDKTEIIEKVASCDDLEYAQYTPASFEQVMSAKDSAQQVIDDVNSVEEDVAAAISLLNQSISDLDVRPDKTALIKTAASAYVDPLLYLPSTYKLYYEAKENARYVVIDVNATEKDVNEAQERLTTSIEGLILRPDKTNLEALLEKAASKSETKYTTVSFDPFEDAHKYALRVYEDDNATIDDVTDAETLLGEALDGLVISTRGIYRIDVWFACRARNHVGNSWGYGAWYNNRDIDGEEITARHGSSISIYCKIVEHDKIPDVGSGYLNLPMKDDAEKTISIYVRENRGRYSGNRAHWNVTGSVELIERIA